VCVDPPAEDVFMFLDKRARKPMAHECPASAGEIQSLRTRSKCCVLGQPWQKSPAGSGHHLIYAESHAILSAPQL